jgi:hypothetical protein
MSLFGDSCLGGAGWLVWRGGNIRNRGGNGRNKAEQGGGGGVNSQAGYRGVVWVGGNVYEGAWYTVYQFWKVRPFVSLMAKGGVVPSAFYLTKNVPGPARKSRRLVCKRVREVTVAERVWYKRKDSTTKRGKHSRKEKRKEKEMKVLRDTSAPPSVRVVGARNLHKRVCRLACGDCALHKRVKPGLELLSPLTLSYPVPPRMKQRDDLHTNHTGANTWRCFLW